MVEHKTLPPKSMSVLGIINILLSFLMPFIGIPIAAGMLGYALMFNDPNRWNPAAVVSLTQRFMPGIMGVSAVVGVINAVGYYRKKYRS